LLSVRHYVCKATASAQITGVNLTTITPLDVICPKRVNEHEGKEKAHCWQEQWALAERRVSEENDT